FEVESQGKASMTEAAGSTVASLREDIVHYVFQEGNIAEVMNTIGGMDGLNLVLEYTTFTEALSKVSADISNPQAYAEAYLKFASGECKQVSSVGCSQ